MTELPEQFQPFVKEVLKYYKLPYINIEIANMGSAIACQGYSTVHASEDLIREKSDDVIKTVLAHEISHRSLYPGTIVEQETHTVIAQMEGIHNNNIPTFLNIIYDLLLDRINLLFRDWSDTYIIGMEDLRPWKFNNDDLSADTIFNNLVVAMTYDYYHHEYTLGETEQKVYDLLYIDSRPFESRLIDLAQIFKKWLQYSSPNQSPRNKDEESKSNEKNETQDTDGQQSNTDSSDDDSEKESSDQQNSHPPSKGNGKGCGKPNSTLPLDRNLSPDELRDVAEKLSQIYEELDSDILMNKDIRTEFKKRRAKKIALPLITAGENTKSRTLIPAGTWNPGYSINELDLIRTINTHGIIIPELTTQRVAEIELPGTPSDAKRPHAVILADVSGSMNSNNAIERLIDVIVAINMIAKRKEWPITLIKFNHGSMTLAEKSRDYFKVEDEAVRLAAGGGTSIHSAIKKAEQYKGGMALFVITDQSNTSLLVPETYNTLQQIKQRDSDIFLYCIGQEFSNDFKKKIKPVVTKAFSIPHGQSYVESIVSNAMNL